ncbi:MAG: RNA methyltransferase [Acidobacteriaceae bacterium]
MLTPAELDRICTVLVATRNPNNLGAAARAMSNFGFPHLRVVNPYEIAFREARSAVGASAVMASAQEFATVAEAVADCTLVIGTTAAGSRQLQHPLRLLRDAAAEIRSTLSAPTTRIALLFGSEKNGLSNEDLSHCHWLMRIPTRDQHSSMNLGQAVAICLYELAHGEAAASAACKQPALATAAELERIRTLLQEALDASGYSKQNPAEDSDEKIRRLVHRMGLQAGDAEIWMGMLRRMLYQMQKK